MKDIEIILLTLKEAYFILELEESYEVDTVLKNQRLEIIKELVKKEEIVHIDRFLDVLDVSESTIRRDLDTLEQMGFLKRIHGGVQYIHKIMDELAIEKKLSTNLEEKQKIARYAAGLVEDGDCIYLDAGSTTYGMIPHLRGKNITVITNGIPQIEALIKEGINTHVVAGQVKKTTGAIVGEHTLEYLDYYYFDKAFLGVNGISMEHGFSTPDIREAAIKQAVLTRSHQCYFLADSSKFNQNYLVKIAEINEATVITEKVIDNYNEKMTIKVASS